MNLAGLCVVIAFGWCIYRATNAAFDGKFSVALLWLFFAVVLGSAGK